MSTRPPWLPSGGSGILMLVILLIVIAALFFWARSAHPPGTSHPAATGVPPTAPPGATPTAH
jgi:hypothetical protein